MAENPEPRTSASYATLHQLFAADEEVKANDESKAKALLEALDNEFSNAMLVSALIFTVAAQGILAPDKRNITGTHTDLYGGLCVFSLLSCLGSVLMGTAVRREISRLLLKTDNQTVANMITEIKNNQPCAALFFSFPVWFMWMGALAITCAMAVNALQVLGIRTFLAFSGFGSMIFMLVFTAFFVLKRQRQIYERKFKTRPGTPGRERVKSIVSKDFFGDMP